MSAGCHLAWGQASKSNNRPIWEQNYKDTQINKNKALHCGTRHANSETANAWPDQVHQGAHDDRHGVGLAHRAHAVDGAALRQEGRREIRANDEDGRSEEREADWTIVRHLELIPLENNIVTESRELKVTRKTERDLTNSLKRTKDEQ